MLNSLLTRVVLITSMIAVLGQAFAWDTLSCDMMESHSDMQASDRHPQSIELVHLDDHQHDAAAHHGMMKGHDMMQHMAMNSDISAHQSEPMNDNCCEKECSCPVSGCSSFQAAMWLVSGIPLNTSFGKIPDSANNSPLSHPISLFRPPIIA